ncbi:beta-propeller fold lactonase family protein [Sorangium atrum]|uniref:Beta-propeller fold lactonase family protein n=1 Tax=Sorangium atrum TaxID=2995308 RepID=A0ABT5BUF0_9BACT|nr:beta-propeller fold lactonase family protein [Sorangium aterium]MDC0677780.1 beta-propeller fold lactonase family protein [Sorangium aterium]
MLLAAALPAAAATPFTTFESGQVRPLALSANGKLLFAVNTPDNRLEIFRVEANRLQLKASVPVGLEPVAVAARGDDEVWVVNHLSDSVSVVDVRDLERARVVRTLLVGDEPRDIVFAGPQRSRAFITTAHRGQNAPFDPQLLTPGIGRADVWVFDARRLGTSLGGTPLSIVTLFSDTPRALAVTPDGSRVYAAAFHSGNRTTVIDESLVPDGGEAAGGLPGPDTNFEGVPRPEVGLILKFNGAHWVDELGRPFDDAVRLSLPDKDVFVIDALANPPRQVDGPGGFFTGVGTILFNMVVNPVNGKVYVSNTDARNEERFEGPGIFAGHSVRGHLHESRITVLGPGGVAPRHLNKHIDYSSCCAPVPNDESKKSLAQPTQMAVTRNGATLYVAALGSDKIGVFDTAKLENDTFVPSVANQIRVPGGGPTGLVLDEDRQRLYVLARFDNAISVIDTRTRREVAHVPMHNPEPPSVVRGRRVLYDASRSSSHGDSSCASCHIFGDFDSLAWDLGNPDGSAVENPGPFCTDLFGQDTSLHPMKGPMTTQSLRGMANHGPMHWRGDRTGGQDAPTSQPDSGVFDERAAFKKFSVSFVDLLGRDETISEEEMDDFTDFILQVTYPPNPIRALDDSLTPDESAGRDFFGGPVSSILGTSCIGCHVVDPDANPDDFAPGFFGSDGGSANANETQLFKVPHLRNQYQKVGMFGMAESFVFPFGGSNAHMGDQVRGFGFLHDGAVDTLVRFNAFSDFVQTPENPGGFSVDPEGELLKRQVAEYMLALESNLKPIVGQQITLTSSNAAVAGPRVDLLVARADAGDCDLVVKGWSQGDEVGFLYIGNGRFEADRARAPRRSDGELRWLGTRGGGELTYTCVPPGSGGRIGVDRDGDGFRDGDERDAGSDPADPQSIPRRGPHGPPPWPHR